MVEFARYRQCRRSYWNPDCQDDPHHRIAERSKQHRVSNITSGIDHNWLKSMARNFPIPKFPESIAITFRRLCVQIDNSLYDQFVEKISPAMNNLHNLAASGSSADTEFIAGIVRAAEKLMEEGRSLDIKRRSLVIGAVSYLVADDDPIPDSAFRSGLYDDARIINHVLEELNIEGYFITIPTK